VVCFCRIHNALKGIPDDRDGLFDTIQRSKNHYQKRAYQCIKCMVALFSNCPVAYQILQVILFVLLLAAFFPVLYIPKKKKKSKLPLLSFHRLDEMMTSKYNSFECSYIRRSVDGIESSLVKLALVILGCSCKSTVFISNLKLSLCKNGVFQGVF